MPLLWISMLLFLKMCESAPIEKHMVDMTHPLDDTTLFYPHMKKYEMDVIMNGTNEHGVWIQYEEFAVGVHVGTHMDAPAHFVLGKWTADQIPPNRFIAPAAVIDIREKAEANRDAELEIEDLLRWESETGQSLDGTIVVMRTGWNRYWSNRTAYLGTQDEDATQLHFPGMAPAAAQWLVDNRNIYALATDTLSLDHGPSQIYTTHVTLLSNNIYGLENVANTDKLPIYGAMIYAMPLKMSQASGAPVRIIATYPKVLFN